MSPKLILTKITDLVFLTYELVIGNRRLIFPTMIGLIIALTVISQSGVLIESYRQEIFEETVFKNQYYWDQYEGDVTVEVLSQWDNTWDSDMFTDFDQYNSLINKSINQVNFSKYILDYYWYSSPRIGVWLNRTEIFGPFENQELGFNREITCYTSSSLDFYNQLDSILESTGKGRLPENSSEILLIRPKGMASEIWDREGEEVFENLTLGTEVNITLEWGAIPQETRINKTVTIVGLVEFQRPAYDYYYEYSTRNSVEKDNVTKLIDLYLRSEYYYYEGLYSFLTLPSFLNTTIKSISENYSGVEWRGGVTGKITLDQNHFNAFNFADETTKLQNFILALEQQFYTATSSPNISSKILNAMRDFQYQIFGLIISMLLVSFPVICIALYLVVYSFGLIRKQKQEQIGIIKTRGGSWLQVVMILLGEMLLSTILAVIVGFILSIFLADVVMRSSDFLEFLGVQLPVQISRNMVQDLIVWGLLLALLLNFRKIIRMSRLGITESLVPTETRDPVWKRYYLDITMFVIGTAIWIILMTLLRTGLSGDDIEPMFYILYPIISLLGLPAPFLMFFGTILIIARFFPFLMKKIADILWKLEGGVNAFAIRNIVRHKQAANRAVLLITLALSFAILASSLTFSLDETEHLKKYYGIGADISVGTGSNLNESIGTLLEKNVSHLTSISGVYTATHESYGTVSRRYNFLFVNTSTYAKTAFNDHRFKLSDTLTNLMIQLADNESIMLYEGNLKADVSKPGIGGNISLRFSNDTQSELLEFNVAGTFKYWPTMFPYEWYEHSRYFWIIGSLGMFEQLNESAYFYSHSAKYQAKIDSINNIEETVDTIYNVTKISEINAPALDYKEYITGFNRKFTLSILNSDLLVCISISVIGIIMFAFFTYVERGKEIGVERALGMTRLQTAQSFLVEAAMILTFGTIIGCLTGAYFVTMFLQITQFGQTIPPIIVSYPTTLLVQMLLSILVVAGIGTIIPAYLATRKDISRILKVE